MDVGGVGVPVLLPLLQLAVLADLVGRQPVARGRQLGAKSASVPRIAAALMQA
jgi:hypothetical protein